MVEERRKHPRLETRFMVSYKLLDEEKIIDISHTKNVSLGGLLLTTNKEFEPGTKLALNIRLPFSPKPLSFIGKVVESKKVVKDLIYDTRIELLSASEEDTNIFKEAIETYSKTKEKK